MELFQPIIEHQERTICSFFTPQYAKLKILELYYKFFHKFWDIIKYDSLKAVAKSNIFPRTCCSIHKKLDKRELGFFKEAPRCTEKLCLRRKIRCCYDNKSDKFKIISKWVKKLANEDSGDRPMSKYRRVLDEALNLTSTYIWFRTINHTVASYEQAKKGFSYCCSKRQVRDDGLHTKTLDL